MEMRADWVFHEGALPTIDMAPHMYHAQFALSERQAAQLQTFCGNGTKAIRQETREIDFQPDENGRINTVLSSAPGDERDLGYLRREGVCCGLADLFLALGNTFDAAALYAFYEANKKIVFKRQHGKSHPTRQVASSRRFQETGRWGWG